MDSNSKELLELLDTEQLMKLLGETSANQNNHPFIVYLDVCNIGVGDNKIPISLMQKLHKHVTGKLISEKKLYKLCDKYLNNGDIFLDVTKAYIQRKLPKRVVPLITDQKKKFETFIKANAAMLGAIEYGAAYVLYTKWRKKNNLRNPLTEEQFIGLCRLYFT